MIVPDNNKHAKVEGIGEARNPAGDEPQRGAGEQQHVLRLAMIEQARARPCHRERGEENGVGEIDSRSDQRPNS